MLLILFSPSDMKLGNLSLFLSIMPPHPAMDRVPKTCKKACLKNHFVVSILRFCDLHIQEVNKFEQI